MIVLDANILIRAVLGKRVRQLLETYAVHGIRFYAPEVAYTDAEKYLPALLAKRGKSNSDLPATLTYLQSLIEPIGEETYGLFEADARQRLRGRDEEDWPVLATALIHHFHGNWTVPGLVSHLRNEFDKLVELESIALQKGIPIYEPFQGAVIGQFVVLAPSRERYISLIPDLDKAPQTYTKTALDWLVKVAEKAVALVRETWSPS
jgi:predicted nucleic acid-binding protein